MLKTALILIAMCTNLSFSAQKLECVKPKTTKEICDKYLYNNSFENGKSKSKYF